MSSTYFPLFKLALRPASTPDSNRRRSSISPPRNHVAFSLAKQVSLEHSISSPCLFLLREGNKNIQTNDRQMTRQKVSPQVVDRSSARSDRYRGQRCSAATFPSNSKYRYRPLTQPDVANCWPCNVCFGLAESVLKLCKLGAEAKSICDENPHVRSLHRSTVVMLACECCLLGGWTGFGSCGCARSADIGCHGARPGYTVTWACHFQSLPLHSGRGSSKGGHRKGLVCVLSFLCNVFVGFSCRGGSPA